MPVEVVPLRRDRATKSWRLFTRYILSLHSQGLGPQAGPPRWVFKSWVGNAGDIGGVSIYISSDLFGGFL